MSLEQLFPNLIRTAYTITSPTDINYNCAAWAAGENDKWWWPEPDSYWPPYIPREDTVEVFVQAFSSLGYELCDNTDVEPGFEKIAIYVDHADRPRHVSRQLQSGRWTSKLGELQDIEHSFDGLDGPDYGVPRQVLKRRI